MSIVDYCKSGAMRVDGKFCKLKAIWKGTDSEPVKIWDSEKGWLDDCRIGKAGALDE